jgi:uncharacterized ubiquitin-like protein YukD
MKVQVVVKNSNKAAATTTTIDATVGRTDMVINVQELIASMTKTFSFPDQKLIFKGKTLAGNQRLSECGIKDGDVLDFEFQASEQTLVDQLSELIGKSTMSPEELSLLYSYRYAVSFEDALHALGHANGQIRSFMESQKCFSFQGNSVTLGQSTEKAAQPLAALSAIKEDKAHGLIEVRLSVEVHVAGKMPQLLSCDEDEDTYMRLESSDTVARAKEIIAASEQMPFPERELLLGETKLQDSLSLGEAGVKNGSSLVLAVHASEASLASQLESLLRERKALSASELGLHYCQRFGTPVGQALRILGLHANLGRFLEGHSQFSSKGGCVTLTNGPKLVTPVTQEEKAYAQETLNLLIDRISEASFLSINNIQMGHGTNAEVQATIFVNGLPPSCEAPLLKGLQKAVSSSLEAMSSDELAIESAKVVGEVVEVQVKGSQTVSIRLEAAPVCFQ